MELPGSWERDGDGKLDAFRVAIGSCPAKGFGLGQGAAQWNEPSRALNMASARGRGERMEFRGVGIRKREKKFDAFGTWGDRASSNKGAEE